MNKLALACGAAILALALACAPDAEAQITGKETEKTETAFVDRSLVLPEMTVMGELDGSYLHFEAGDTGFSVTINGGFVDLGAKFGLLDDLEAEMVFLSILTQEGFYMPTSIDLEGDADWGLFRLGATLRFLATDAAEMGVRFRFLADNNAVIGLNGGIPIMLHGGNVIRLDTGIGWIGRFNQPAGITTGGETSFGLVDVNSSPMGPEAGIPLRLAIQAIEQLWFGVNTGFGAFDVGEDDTIFLPLGATLGGTIDADPLLVDVIGNFNFPFFVTPTGDNTEERVQTEVWQIGLAARAYFALPK